ncbi:hypothetical protein [Burkholderia cepacia]|uniref:hypothetical protein n=1 Tax=Burkholderia cepacia TaxID=292 RepID=UPI0012D9ADBA|nr:hypothetical protein [Burkholderia cepacia]
MRADMPVTRASPHGDTIPDDCTTARLHDCTTARLHGSGFPAAPSSSRLPAKPFRSSGILLNFPARRPVAIPTVDARACGDLPQYTVRFSRHRHADTHSTQTCGLRVPNARRMPNGQFCRRNLRRLRPYDFLHRHGLGSRRDTPPGTRRHVGARSNSCCAGGSKRSIRIVRAGRIATNRILAMLK